MFERTSSQTPNVLLQYASFHRDQRNILLHTFCVPIILFALTLLFRALSLHWEIGMLIIGTMLLSCITVSYTYVAGTLGLVTSSLIVSLYLLSQFLSQWFGIATSVILLLSGYLGHRLGHWYEGNTQHPMRFGFFAAAPLFSTLQLIKNWEPVRSTQSAVETYAGPAYIRNMMNEQPSVEPY